MTKEDNTVKYILGIVALVAIAYMFGFIPGNTPTTNTLPTPPPLPGQAPTQGQQAPATLYVQPAPTTPSLQTGTLTLKPTSADSTGGKTASMLFLSPTYAVYSNGVYDEQATRYNIMKAFADKGAIGLLSVNNNAPTIQSVSSNAWSETVNAKVGDKLIAFTFTASGNTYKKSVNPDNITTAKLLKLTDYNAPNQVWSSEFVGGGAPNWQIPMHANYTFVDDKGVLQIAYSVGDNAAVALNQQIPFFIQGATVGEDCADCGLFLIMPKNFTTKFKDVTISPRSLEAGCQTDCGAVKWTTLQDPAAAGVSVASSLISGNATTFQDTVFYLGTIPSGWNTQRTSADRNQITGTLTTDTYGTPVNGTMYVIQNVHAPTTTYGAFVGGNWYNIRLTTNPTSTGYQSS